MSALLKCFSKKSSDGDESSKSEKKKKKCRCKCHKNSRKSDDSNMMDQCDGKRFSKILQISGKQDKHSISCCDSDKDGSPESYLTLRSSPIATVSPGGTPFFIDYESYDSNLPGRSYMPVSKDDPFYNMNHPRRGKAIIFNFDRWDNTNIPHLGLSPRRGSEKDKHDLARCLRRFDFEVEDDHDNLKHLEMWAVLERLRQEDHTNADCLMVIVMTHGEKNTIYTRDGTQIPINLIWEFFEAHRCPSLAGKPKIFIVQACRGKQYDSGTTLHPQIPAESESNQSDVTDASTFSYVIPNAADIIGAFSCPLGHYSWRHPERGSWFIQAICKVFGQHFYDMDLQTLFTTVAREVALNYQSNTTNVESNNKKQVTSTSSTLIRTVKFHPKLQPELPSPPVPYAQEIAEPESLEQGRVTLRSMHTSTNNEEINLVTNSTAQMTFANDSFAQNVKDIEHNEVFITNNN